MGVCGIYGCDCKEAYRLPHITYPYSSCIFFFLQQHPYFLFNFYFNIYIMLNHATKIMRVQNIGKLIHHLKSDVFLYQ